MGWTILYIAFGLVALWLLGEVLLQYKARLRWRLLAFTGFLGVVVGVIIPSVIVIGVGLIAFATGQTLVTLSFKRGFTTGWALGGKPGESRRRRARPSAPPAAAEPILQVSEVEPVPAGDAPVGASGPGPGGGGQDAFGPDAAGPFGPEAAGQDTFESTGGFRNDGGFAGNGGYAGDGGFGGDGGFRGDGGFADQGTYAGEGTYAGQGAYGHQSGDQRTSGTHRGQDPYEDPQDQSVFATQAFPMPPYDAPYDALSTASGGSPARADATAVYAPEPLPEETGQYGIYSTDARGLRTGYPDHDGYGSSTAAEGAGGSGGDGNGYVYGGSYGRPAAGEDAYADPYAAYGDGREQQSAYADPYTDTPQHTAPYDSYAQHGSYAQPDPYTQAPYGADPYGGQGGPLDQSPGQGYGETAPGGSWVPQQRDGDIPPEQPPYPPYQQQGYDGQQYRY
ncbi:putative hypothetical protein [Streptomyces sp. NBRC 110611]|uniref:hypothetical protein n=1 Tax=Streptomyces sp. NBRC 110611 TaxID=1621259 RepID=UPI00082B8817|nr:putative hypothetical protein [Streptomyces sp. NBRC 110611]